VACCRKSDHIADAAGLDNALLYALRDKISSDRHCTSGATIHPRASQAR